MIYYPSAHNTWDKGQSCQLTCPPATLKYCTHTLLLDKNINESVACGFLNPLINVMLDVCPSM